MKTIQTNPDGSKLLLVTAAELRGLEAAVTIAYEDEEAVPEDFQEVGRSLWNDLVRSSPVPEVAARAFPPAGWEEYQTGGGCTALRKEVPGAELMVTVADDPAAPAGADEPSVLGVYPLPASGEYKVDAADDPSASSWTTGEYVLEVRGSAGHVLAVGDRVGFVSGRLVYVAFKEAGCYLAVGRGEGQRTRRTLFYCPMNADGTPDRDSWGEVENPEGINFAEVNSIFGASFSADQFYRRG